MASVPNLNAVDHNDEEDMYLSDIHIEQHSDNEKSSIRVEIRMPPAILEDRGKNLMIDSDGDFVRSSSNMYVIRIEHDMATTLSRVGLQLWRASFFLSDYVLNNLELVRDKTVIELGTGLGLVSFVTSAYARLVFATDLGFVVQRARQNWIANQKRIDWTSGGEIRFKKLVWDNYESIFDPPSKSSETPNDFDLNDEDVNDLKEASVILAADVVYDDLITIKFMNTVYKLLTCSSRRQSRCCIVANEKRINFSAMSLSAGDTAYDYFMSCLRDLDGYMDIELGYRFECEEIKTTISSGSEEDHDKLVKYIKNYRRNKFLYIWKITSFPI